MDEASILPAKEPQDEIEAAEADSGQAPFPREAHDEVAARTFGGSAYERLGVRVTADDLVHHHRVGRIHPVLSHVADPVLGARVDPGFLPELAREGLVRWRELGVYGFRSAGFQQLGLQRPDSAADLEDR